MLDDLFGIFFFFNEKGFYLNPLEKSIDIYTPDFLPAPNSSAWGRMGHLGNWS